MFKPIIYNYTLEVYMVSLFWYLKHIFFAGLFLCSPSNCCSIQIHSEFWNNLIGLALWKEKYIDLKIRLFLKMALSGIESALYISYLYTVQQHLLMFLLGWTLDPCEMLEPLHEEQSMTEPNFFCENSTDN